MEKYTYSDNMIILKTSSQVDKLRRSGQLVKTFLTGLKDIATPGVTTNYLDKVAIELAESNNALPGFKGYKGFPYAICASINDQVVHGFPSNRVLLDGDILSVDFGILLDGYYGDAAITLPIGNISNEAERLITTTRECLYKGISEAVPGNRVNNISKVIQQHAEANGYSVVKEFVGHGIGRSLHEKPQIPNYSKVHKGALLKAGMVIAIEPMLVEGSDASVVRDLDGWTVSTKTGKLSAHYEHTIVITKTGPEILSKI